ncbi:HD domain-containing phosphohydrolase [Marinospirillum sp.]|uniref:HD-GYP domain-containing protein n=1 Tax=Marinospirillum sp. TaxID=2183934 RepID=UPI0028701152|nr:HD domain-containing phosphohydrolase [Marinospirillum sp.]MDR9467223.1 response regulator [Marinospirillum sp.]
MPLSKAVVDSRIFLVDDELVNLKLLQKMLGGQGYSELVAISDARQVLTEYQKDRPDLILLDINMPHLDGFEVMEQLKALNDPLLPPILILTAQHAQEYLLRSLALGARDMLTKPFDRTELLMRVRNLLEVHQSQKFMHDQNGLLETLVAERTRELNQTRKEVIRRLGRAAEFRDNETGFHIIRMSKYAVVIARSLGWSEVDCDLLLNATPMHDVGKIGIPDHILLKPGKLEADEWEAMKNHSSIGAALLSGDPSPLFTLAREIAATHHEKWNGQGYPDGLEGESIPQSGRIAAVADVFDALTSARPYKKAWSVEAAVELIQQEAGRHFDPEVVEHFLACLPEILDIKQHYSDQPLEQESH